MSLARRDQKGLVLEAILGLGEYQGVAVGPPLKVAPPLELAPPLEVGQPLELGSPSVVEPLLEVTEEAGLGQVRL